MKTIHLTADFNDHAPWDGNFMLFGGMPTPIRIETVLMVGGYINEINSNRLLAHDDINFKDSVSMCRNAGFTFADTLTVQVQNLAYGDDFLLASPPVDLVIFSYIFYAPGFKYALQSPHAFDEGAWHQGLVRSQALAAVNIGGSYSELPTNILTRPPYYQVGRQNFGHIYDLVAKL